MATDILYIVGKNKSQWYDRELRYSLRSLCKYGRNVGRVFVVGFPPPFLNTQEVQTLKVIDPTDKKHKNIIACIDAAVKHFDLQGDFLYSSDDHFYIRETDFDTYPIYCKGSLPTEWKTPYRHSLCETRELLSLCGLSVYNFSWHGNTHFNGKVWQSREFQSLINIQHRCTEEGAEPTCLMLNYMRRIAPFDFIERPDGKMFNFTQEEWQCKATDRECISSDDGIENKDWLADFLKREFPDRCKYERN